MRLTPNNFEDYIQYGCGRCDLGGTDQCKVHSWTQEINALRTLLLRSGLKEEIKWSMPTYTLEGRNVLILAAFKEFCSLNFFKGVLLEDPDKLLESPGENSQSARYLKIRSMAEFSERKEGIELLIQRAMEVEMAGTKVEFKKVDDYEVPVEFQTRLDEFPALKAAFEQLTPGRRKGYLIHFAQAKQAATRVSRIEKCIPRILEGKGMMD
jgi:uncharacterized protein YdeI (YjbR/CyaY-like superfamily)